MHDYDFWCMGKKTIKLKKPPWREELHEGINQCFSTVAKILYQGQCVQPCVYVCSARRKGHKWDEAGKSDLHNKGERHVKGECNHWSLCTLHTGSPEKSSAVAESAVPGSDWILVLAPRGDSLCPGASDENSGTVSTSLKWRENRIVLRIKSNSTCKTLRTAPGP